ncbi:MFS transporter [Epidermidibacterium keratini]|uniref:MFS transporter n=2 Tax=Epidermidibacterium keratini TaxID=1891644 RepID=A0A7L4YTZ0_9ACTN|nr:MFS transporter [Epidermidibacterium keratini]
MLDAITADTGWSATSASAAFSTGLIVSALIGVPTGWLLERYGPRVVMTAGSALAAPCAVLIALAPNIAVFTIGWLLAGLAMAATLYTAAFTAITSWFGAQRLRGITMVTLVGGLSSTVFAPITSFLMDHLTWRETFLVLAGVLAVITIPTHWFGLALPWRPVTRHSSQVDVRSVVRTVRFGGFALGMAVMIFCGFAAAMLIVALSIERGYSRTFGAVLLGLVGVGLVIGRGSYVRLAGRLPVRTRIPVVYICTITAIVLLAVVSGPVGLLAVIATLLGMTRGAGTLLQASFVADMWGTERYGALNGIFSAPMTIGMALAPFGGTAIAEAVGGYSQMMLVLAGIGVITLVAMMLLARGMTEHSSVTSSPG